MLDGRRNAPCQGVLAVSELSPPPFSWAPKEESREAVVLGWWGGGGGEGKVRKQPATSPRGSQLPLMLLPPPLPSGWGLSPRSLSGARPSVEAELEQGGRQSPL